MPQHRVTVFSSNYALYGDMSRRMMNVLSRFAPLQEIYSIDECFLDVTGIPDLDSHGHRIRQAVCRAWAFPPAWAWVPARRWPSWPTMWPKSGRSGTACLNGTG
jgi:DNA polymerase V